MADSETEGGAASRRIEVTALMASASSISASGEVEVEAWFRKPTE